MRAAARLAALALLAAVAAAPPAAPLSRSYHCFFDAGSAELSPRCQDVALAFLEWWHRARRGEDFRYPEGTLLPARAMKVEVHGHADTAEAEAGSAANLSRARAEAAAAFLRLNGVPADVIEVRSFGADRLLALVAGAEPQNRRAEIIAR